jgi:hypothetical protein
MGKSTKDDDKYDTFIQGYIAKHGCHPIPAEIARGTGVSRQAVRIYFDKHADRLKTIPEYKRYFA